ncbi:MAG: hypothetical protein HC890_05320 [Chloroflexaceae bacterium]|nr:hypothetical protein [Chloroflexaceae bacterium]
MATISVQPMEKAIAVRQPLGGVQLSEIGSKASGLDYLQEFLEPRAITENT